MHARTWKCVEKRTLTELVAPVAVPWLLATALLLGLVQTEVALHASHAGKVELLALAVGIQCWLSA